MKITTAYAIAWASVSLAATTAVIVTESIEPLWFLLIPAMVTFKGLNDKKEDKKRSNH